MIRILVSLSLLCFSSLAFAGASGQSGLAKVTSAASIAMNAYMGKTMMAKCKVQPTGAWACPIALMSFAQIPAQVETLLDSGDVEKKTSSPESMGDFGSGFGADDSAATQRLGAYDAEAKGAIKKLKGMGYDLKKDGSISGPGGTTAAGSAAGSGQDMADAGLIDPENIGDYNDALKDYKKKKDKIIVKSMGSAKGGYTARKRRPASTDDYRYNSGLDRSQIQAAQTGGLTKSFGGDSIGVASDDLFRMLSERYDILKQDKQFIDNKAGTYAGQR